MKTDTELLRKEVIEKISKLKKEDIKMILDVLTKRMNENKSKYQQIPSELSEAVGAWENWEDFDELMKDIKLSRENFKARK